MAVVPFRNPIIFLQGRATDNRQQFTRDQAITVKVNFFDADGNVANPAAATLTISYRTINDNCRTHADYTLTKSGNDWSYTWDSSIARRGKIFGHIASGDKTYAADFTFRLTAELANRELAGDDDYNGYVV